MKGFYYIGRGIDIMRALQVYLRQEVTQRDAASIMNWMKDQEVIQYLNETSNIVTEIEMAMKRVNMFIMTHLFNRGGSFFLICTDANNPVGFVKLVQGSSEAEMVIVIGERKNWGHGYGTRAIHKGLSYAFFERRIPRVVAKIHSNNSRSIKIFEKAGFTLEKDSTHTRTYCITMEDFIKQYS
jgi:RimJ/RimL family protein N-acetyltransferase